MTTHSSTTTPSPTTPQVAEPPRFAKGDRVRVPERHWLMHYHSLPHDPKLDAFVVAGRGGVIMQMRQNKRTGIRRYQVLFNLGDAWGREDMYIREEHLVMVEAAHPAPAPVTAPSEPRFEIGDWVRVAAQSRLAYEPFTRHGAVGEVISIDKPVRSIRRYSVHYDGDVPRMASIREEHLEPAPQQQATEIETHPYVIEHDDGTVSFGEMRSATVTVVMTEQADGAVTIQPKPSLQHAYEYTDFRDARPNGNPWDIWCDAGACVMAACPVCRAQASQHQASQHQRRKTREPKEPHIHRWQPFGSDDHFEFCAGCGQGRRTDRAGSVNPCVALWGAGPEGATCGDCAHRRAVGGHARTYWKCELRTDLTHGAKTDQRASWPACARWKLNDNLKRGGKEASADA